MNSQSCQQYPRRCQCRPPCCVEHGMRCGANARKHNDRNGYSNPTGRSQRRKHCARRAETLLEPDACLAFSAGAARRRPGCGSLVNFAWAARTRTSTPGLFCVSDAEDHIATFHCARAVQVELLPARENALKVAHHLCHQDHCDRAQE
jgi:hypothetical protein